MAAINRSVRRTLVPRNVFASLALALLWCLPPSSQGGTPPALIPSGLPAAASCIIAQSAEQDSTDSPASDAVRREFTLPPDKADALFKLLEFDDVKVVVWRTADGVRTAGTPREVRVLDALVKIITREQSRSIEDPGAYLEELRRTWDSVVTYQLPSEKADALFQLLAFDDVPVMVSHAPNGVTVEAGKDDQKTIEWAVQIISGERLIAGRSDAQRRNEQHQPPARRGQQPRDNREGLDDQSAERRRGLEDEVARMKAELQRQVADMRAQAEKLQEEARQLNRRIRELTDRIDREIGQSAEFFERRRAERGQEPQADRDQRPDAGAVVEREYELPKHHADNLFALLAPADLEDVVVSRDGNTIRIRAAIRDQNTIERLVKMLTRGRTDKETAAGKEQENEGKG